jgi:apolipoprotein N-acyltransferase
LLLTLSFPPFKVWPAVFFAIAPLSFLAVRRAFKWPYALVYTGLGALFWLCNVFWLAPVTVLGYVIFALFLALYFPLYAWVLGRLVNGLRLPATIAVPVVWTALEFVRANYPEGGFAWFLLGNAAAPAPVMIQGADLLGVWGVTFLVAMVNGLWVDLLRLPLKREGRVNRSLVGRAAVVAGVLATWVGYGVWRLGQRTVTPGPRVAVLQENIPQAVKDAGDHDEEVFERHLKLSDEASEMSPRPDLVVWPETMVPGWTNREYLDAPASTFRTFEGDFEFWTQMQERGRLYLQVLQHRADARNVALLLGQGALVPGTNLNDSEKQNRVVLMEPRAGVVQSYAKIHLVPFGEYIPWRKAPVVGKWMLAISPYGFDYSCTPGIGWTRFELARGERRYSFGTPICFEDTMPGPARAMVKAGNGKGKADFLVSVSNDGWFHWVQLDQHLQATQLRAVEERVWIARSVNTGDSGFVDSCGRVVGLVRGADEKSAGAVGTLAMEVGVDSRVTVYSVVGDLLPVVCGVAGVLGLGWTAVRPRR